MRENRFLFSNCTICDGELFFVGAYTGLMTKMNSVNGKSAYLCAIEDLIDNSDDTVEFIQSYKDQIYILEMSGKNMIIYDLANMEIKYVRLDCGHKKWGNFVAFERFGSDYYIFLRHENKIIQFDTATTQVTPIEVHLNGSNEVQCCCRAEDNVFMIPLNGNVINEYNLRHNEIRSWKLDKVLENCVDAAYGNGSIYILNRFGIIYKWEIYSNSIEKINMLETEHIMEESMCKLVYVNNKLIVFPALGQDIKILDLSSQEGNIYHDYPKDFFYSDIEWSKYYGVCEDEQFYYFAMRLGNYLLKICKSDGSMIWVKPQEPLETDKMKIYLDIGKTVFKEETEMSLSGFLNVKLMANNKSTEKNYGKMIFERVMT